MRLLFHAGMNKTGSSALQTYLDDHRDALRDRGIVYPDLGHRSHWRFAAALVDRAEASDYFLRRLDRRGAEDDGRDAPGSIRTAITTAGDGDLIILSHESFGKAAQAEALVRFLDGCGVSAEDVTVLAYVRPPVRHFPSAVQQRLKTRVGTLIAPDEWRSDHIARAETLRDRFGDRAILRAYAPGALVDGDIVADVRTVVERIFGRTLPRPIARIAVNTALSAPACAVLQSAKGGAGARFEARDFTRLRAAIVAFDEPRTDPLLVMPPHWAAWIAAGHFASWNLLVERLDVEEAIRATLRLEETRPAGRAAIADVRSWILDGYDGDYVRAFLGSGATAELSPEVVGWLDHRIAAMARRAERRQHRAISR